MNDGCDHTSTNAPDPIRTPKNDVRIGTPLGQVMGALRMGVTGGVMRRRVEARNDVRIGTPLGQVMGALRMGVTGGVMRRRVEARSVGCEARALEEGGA
ncbi:hypothetical protein H5410_064830 [Solanum commersonii]|uniref:Uncharacterized protein n=1 Tax=Solanum commersonii TaxID=4109 RepID=A0A9J5VYF0_SOLCO|nr:hypothetical protein H5410_064830 [Solanum commersonii]